MSDCPHITDLEEILADAAAADPTDWPDLDRAVRNLHRRCRSTCG